MQQVWFGRLYRKEGYVGVSSNYGRRTFTIQAARKIIQCGGSLRDVQELAGHAGLANTPSLYRQRCRSEAEGRGADLEMSGSHL
jgi:hypothetical protein